MNSKSRASIRPQYNTRGEVANYYDDQLVVVVTHHFEQDGPTRLNEIPSLITSHRPRNRLGGGPTPLVGCNWYMSHLRDSQMKKNFPSLTQELTVVPTLLDILLSTTSEDREKVQVTNKLKSIFNKLCDAMKSCRDRHRQMDRKPVRLELTLATNLPAARNWMDPLVQDCALDLSAIIKLADSYDMHAFVDYLYQGFYKPLELLVRVPEDEFPRTSSFTPAEKTALVYLSEEIATFFSPMYFRSPISDNIQRRGMSLDRMNIPPACLRPVREETRKSIGLWFGLDPKLFPHGSATMHSAPLTANRSSQSSRLSSAYGSSNIRLSKRYMENVGRIEDMLKHYSLNGESAMDVDTDLTHLGRFEEVDLSRLATLSAEARKVLLSSCCTAVWELYYEITKVRINNLLRGKEVDTLRRAPRNSGELGQLTPSQAEHVRLVRNSDGNRQRNDEVHAISTEGKSSTFFPLPSRKNVDKDFFCCCLRFFTQSIENP